MLDRPVWAALTTAHLGLSVGDALARRYAADVNLFAAARDDSPAALTALTELVQPGGRVFLADVQDVAIPSGLELIKAAKGVQMVATRSIRVTDGDHDIVQLTDADAPEMLSLATLTEPGPFLARTHTMGTFRGIRIGSRLAAMAGERFRFPGYTEVSGVCTHPDFRGRGLARRLSAAVAARIESRGERPFLHAWKANTVAISLYKSLGFELRTEINIKVLERPLHGTPV
jgi:predicted GNAT family acetyltransferase